MKTKRELLIGELHADKIMKERSFDSYLLKKKVAKAAKICYFILSGILGGIIYLSQILEISPIQIFNF